MLRFEKETIFGQFLLPSGQQVEAPIEIRISPITGRTPRIAFSSR